MKTPITSYFLKFTGRSRRWVAWALVAITLFSVGCSRNWYRRKADREVECLVGEKGGYFEGGHIEPNPRSRLYDPFSADCPPLPPDDPASHSLMHCVDGKKGWKHHKYGMRGSVEHYGWLEQLQLDENQQLRLSLREAIGVARLHSREYQTNLENLYISALDVSFERFRFDHQFFAGNQTSQLYSGQDAGRNSTLSVGNFANVSKLTATGGELVVGLANSMVWDFWGNDIDFLSSTLNFSLVQPLLRFGGRARVLENLTQSERTLLANVRQMQQYRQGFYVSLATGRNSGQGPILGTSVGAAGLGLIAGTPSGRSGAPSAGGYLGLLQDQQEIRNQTANIAALRDSLAQLEAAFDANRINSRLQVDQARQALLNAQSSLMSQKAAYQTRVDAFKLELGLPPTLEIEIRDHILDQFVLIDPDLTELQDAVGEILLEIQRGRDRPDQLFVTEVIQSLELLDEATDERLRAATENLTSLEASLSEREKQLELVEERVRDSGADVDPRVYDRELMLSRFQFLKKRFPEIQLEIDAVRRDREKLLNGGLIDDDRIQNDSAGKSEQAEKADAAEEIAAAEEVAALAVPEPQTDALTQDSSEAVASDNTANTEIASMSNSDVKLAPDERRWKQLNANATALSDLLLELSLLNAETRLQGVSLLPLEISVEEAIANARVNRLDWMNARANLVDVWRKIEFVANELKSDLDVFVTGGLGTDPDNLFRFDKNNSRVQFGVRFDTPTTRLIERNRYRTALIAYQRARRDYMQFEDRITQSLRNTLRIVELSQINLEVRRAAVQVAIAQVDIARLKLNPPVRPGQDSRTSPTAARDLVSALTDLLDAQNDFLNVWVSYEVLRVLLDFEMGTMRLDNAGVWIDPGPIEALDEAANAAIESIPGGSGILDSTEFLPPSISSAESGIVVVDELPPLPTGAVSSQDATRWSVISTSEIDVEAP